MKIYLCDRQFNEARPEQASDWAKALLAHFGDDLFTLAEAKGWNEPETSHPAYDCSGAVIFAHSNGGEPKWQKQADTSSCHIILVRHKGRWQKETNEKQNLHGCFWSADEFKDPSRPGRGRVAKLIEQLKSDNPSNVDWRLLRPAPTENLWAIRLLCESWLLKNWNNGRDTHKSAVSKDLFGEQGEETAIRLASENLTIGDDYWLGPFRDRDKGITDEALIQQVVEEILDDDARHASERFLRARLKNDAPPLDFCEVAKLFVAIRDGINRLST